MKPGRLYLSSSFLALIEEDIAWYSKALRRQGLRREVRWSFEETLRVLWRAYEEFKLRW